MARFVKLDEGAFRRGVNETLTLKPFRDAVRELVSGRTAASGATKQPKGGHAIEVTRNSRTGSWHVKRAS